MLEIVTFTLGPAMTNAYLVADSETKEAAVIDPAWDGHAILTEALKRGWRIGHMWYTHAHFDHIGGAAAMVVGDQAQWVRPPDIIARLIPSYPLMWAMFGVIRPPPPGARIRGTRGEGSLLLEWTSGVDTVRYSRRTSSPGTLRAEWQRSGVTMGIVETRLDAVGAPVSSRLTVPSVPARLDLTIVADSLALAFPPSVWTPPAP